MNPHRLVLLLDNCPGVLARVCTVLHRHASNIESLELQTQDDSTTRAAMTLSCPDDDLGLIAARLRNLVNVRAVSTLSNTTAVGQGHQSPNRRTREET